MLLGTNICFSNAKRNEKVKRRSDYKSIPQALVIIRGEPSCTDYCGTMYSSSQTTTLVNKIQNS